MSKVTGNRTGVSSSSTPTVIHSYPVKSLDDSVIDISYCSTIKAPPKKNSVIAKDRRSRSAKPSLDDGKSEEKIYFDRGNYMQSSFKDESAVFREGKLNPVSTEEALILARNLATGKNQDSALRILKYVISSTEMLPASVKFYFEDNQKLLVCKTSNSIALLDGSANSKEICLANHGQKETWTLKKKVSPVYSCRCIFCSALLFKDFNAMTALGYLYNVGFAMEQNITNAMQLYEFASNHGGNLEARFYLGILYLNESDADDSNSLSSEESSRNFNKGVELIKAAAENGFVLAQRKYGYMLQTGSGVVQNIDLAKKMYLSAANQGDLNSMFNYAVLITSESSKNSSRFEEEDDASAPEFKKQLESNLLEKSDSKGFEFDDFNQKGTSETFNEPISLKFPRESLTWLLKAAQLGLSEAQFYTAQYYIESGNLQNGFGWLIAAARQGHVYAQYNLAVMYHTGQGTSRNEGLAFSWFLRAADHGLSEAQLAVAMMYGEGIGICKNLKKARKYSSAALKGGCDLAAEYLEKFQTLNEDEESVILE